MTDEDLLVAFVGGDDPAFDELVRRYGTGIKSYAYRMLHNMEQAEEIYLETFAVMVKERSRLQATGTVRGYLYTVAHRLCIGVIRRRRTESRAAPQLRAIDGGQFTPPRADDAVEASELMADLEQALLALSREHRQVLMLRVVHGLSTRETARAVGLDEQQVRSQLSWARKRLRTLMERETPTPGRTM